MSIAKQIFDKSDHSLDALNNCEIHPALKDKLERSEYRKIIYTFNDNSRIYFIGHHYYISH